MTFVLKSINISFSITYYKHFFNSEIYKLIIMNTVKMIVINSYIFLVIFSYFIKIFMYLWALFSNTYSN